MNDNKPYNILYNNHTGRIIIQKNRRYVSPSKKIYNDLINSCFNKPPGVLYAD
jgi:hypothetical protein